MTTDNQADGDLLFAARLSPHRSLSRTGFRVLIGLIAIVCLTIGLVFAVAGVWPVLGFMGLDVLLIYWAFKANYRAARAYEELHVSRSYVHLRKVSPGGKEQLFEFPQYGTRFQTDRHDEIGITAMRLVNRLRRVEFGQILNPADRESFASSMSLAMAKAKR